LAHHVQLSITFTHQGAVVAMSGDLTWSSGGSLRTVFESTVGDARHVVVDIVGLESLDADGEAILADCIADAHWRGADVVLRTADGRVGPGTLAGCVGSGSSGVARSTASSTSS
jgi:anti-anti-sigma regulatory factor